MSENEESQISSPSQKFEPQEGDEEALWEVIEITGEKAGYYKVRWDGLDPKTMKPWPLSWVPKRDCTDDLVKAWRQKQKRKSKQRDSVASKKSKARESTTSTTSKSRASTVKARSLRSESIATVTAKKTRSSGSIKAVPEEEEESSSGVELAPVKPKDTTSKPKKTGNKRKHAEVSSTHTSANTGVIDVYPEEQGEVVQRKTVPPAKKRKITQSSPLKAEIILPLVSSKVVPRAESPKLVPRYGGRMTVSTKDRRVMATVRDDEDEEEERSVEQALSSPGVPSDRGDVMRNNENGQRNAVSSPSRNGRDLPGPSKKPSSNTRPVEESPGEKVQALSVKPAPLSRKTDSKSSILEGRKRTLTKKRPPVVTSDSDEPHEQPLLTRTASDARDHSTPVVEDSVFWDGEEREIRAVLSPRSNLRLSMFDRELREAEAEEEMLRRKAQKPETAHHKPTNKPKNDSQEVVPETEFSSQSVDMQLLPHISPGNSPPATPPPTQGANTLKSKMQGRTPLSKQSSLNNINAAGPSRKTLRPIPMLDAEVFHPYLQNSIPETIDEDNSQPRKEDKPAIDNESPPLSSIEQFDTPDKSKSKARQPVLQPERLPVNDKGKKKAPAVSKEPSASEIWESDVVQRGQQIAAAAKRKEQELALAGDSRLAGTTSNAKRRSLLDIAQTKSRPQPLPLPFRPMIEEVDEENVQMADDVSTNPVAPSSHPLPPTAPEGDQQLSLDVMQQFINFGQEELPSRTVDPKLLCQEEETSQDLVEHINHINGNVIKPSPPQIQQDTQIPHPSHPNVPPSQPISEQRDKASIPPEPEDFMPLSQDHSQRYPISESLPRPMELDEVGPSGVDAHLSQEISTGQLQWATEREEWHIEKMTLRAEIEAIRLNLKSAEKDREFFREQYTRASAFVSDTIAENRELKQRAEIADGQVKEGVKFVREMYEARTQMLEDDIKHWRNTAQFMIEKDRMTNDDVRKRAAEEPELRKKLAEEKENVFMRDKRIYDLENEVQARNTRVSVLEQEVTHWKHQADEANGELDEAKHKLERIGKEGHEDDDDGHDLVYPCAWRTDGAVESCQAVFTSLSTFNDHVTNAHLPSSS